MKSHRVILLILIQILSVIYSNSVVAQSEEPNSQYSYHFDNKIGLGNYLFTELGYYCCLGDLDKAKELIEGGADIKEGMINDCFKFGTIHPAIISENIELVKYLLDKGVNVNAISSESSRTPLITAISQYQDSETAFAIVKLLLEAGAKADGPGYLGFGGVPTFYPLIEAVKMGDINITKLLIEYGAGFEFENSWEDPIIDLAEQFPNKDIAQKLKEILITAGAK